MGFRLPESFKQKQKEIYDKQVVLLESGEERHITTFEPQSITDEELNSFRMNSYAGDKIFPYLTTDALVKRAEYYRSNCTQSRYPTATYDQALAHLIVPELLNRIKQLEAERVVPKEIDHKKKYLLSLNGNPYGVGDYRYMQELIDNHVETCDMYGSESASFVIERRKAPANTEEE